jgi:hypothetical protein
MSVCASTLPLCPRDRTIDILYKLKYDAPFVPFGIVTKNKRRYSINRPQDLAFPPDRKGEMFVIWRSGKCIVLKFDDVILLKPKIGPSRHFIPATTPRPLVQKRRSLDQSRVAFARPAATVI